MRVRVRIEVPRGSFLKREGTRVSASKTTWTPGVSGRPARPAGRLAEGGSTGCAEGSTRVEYVSPLPSPFNYGCVPDQMAPDGDPLDALVLGPRLRFGDEVDVDVHAVVRFLDAGKVDDKLVCGTPPTARDRRRIQAFFRVYAVARHLMNLARGLRGETRFLGLTDLDEPGSPGGGRPG